MPDDMQDRSGNRVDSGRLVRRWLALLAALTLISFASWKYMALPTVLKVAVGPAGSERELFVRRLAKLLADGRKGVRLDLVPARDSADAAHLLDTDRVQLAVIRSDEVKVADARAIAILDKRVVVLATRADPKATAVGKADKSEDGEVTAVPDVLQPVRLAGKRFVVASDPLGSNRDTVARLLGHAGLGGTAIALTEAPADRIAIALSGDQADVAVLVIDPAAPTTRALIASLYNALGGGLALGSPPAPEGLAAVYKDVMVANLAPGTFGGIEPQPPAKLTTVAITEELVADSDMSDATAGLLSKALLDMRGRMLALGSTYEIESPPTDTSRRFMPHGGIAEKPGSFLETYSDQIWLGLFALGLLGSSLAGLAGWLGISRPKEPEPKPMAGEVSALMQRLDEARSIEDIDILRKRLRELAGSGLQRAIVADLDASDAGHPGQWYPLLDAFARRRREEIAGP